MAEDATIYAVATGAGRAALSVVRLSGSLAGQIVASLCGELPEPRRFQRRSLRDPVSQSLIDDAVVVWLPGPRSFTGEDCAEFHIHASLAVQSALFRSFASCQGIRPAEAGEFTRRAVLNGKMDLVEAEGLADLLDARTSAQRELALGQMTGRASQNFESWRARLLVIRADIEATVDFADEPGVAEEASRRVDGAISELVEELQWSLSQYDVAEVIRDGVRVVLAGRPNTGKSSLLNAIARREAAIVSAIPGTTRDVIEVSLDLDGIPVVLSDTAGLRSGVSDPVEQEGIRRSSEQLERAHVVIWVTAPDVPDSETIATTRVPDMIVRNKADLLNPKQGLNRNESGAPKHYSISARDGLGISELLRGVREEVGERFTWNSSGVVATERQRAAIADSIRYLNDALCASEVLELKAENIGRAAQSIGRITGQTDVEEWLGAIFARFCIGK